MESSVSNEGMTNTILSQIHEDMRVCDSAGEEIGRVREIFLGAVSDIKDQPGVGPATTSETAWRNETLVDNLAEAFADDPLPEVLRDRLLREGYIRIDTHGLFASDRFALPDQIDSISEDCVRLRLTREELIKR
jgi:hypothetical protein